MENTPRSKKLDLKKITDYLYECTYDLPYEYAEKAAYFEKYRPRLGGCSAVSYKGLRGRNYDWNYDNGCEFILRVPAIAGKRHASLGIAASPSVTNAAAMSGAYLPEYDILPFVTLDGVNDAGLFVNTNVVLYRELGPWTMKNNDPSDDRVELSCARLLLDNAATVEEAIGLMDRFDWFSLGTMDECHFMVTGRRSAADSTVATVVLELVPVMAGGCRTVCVSSNDPDDAALCKGEHRFHLVNEKDCLIMTNFHLFGFDPEDYATLTKHAMGVERYELIKEHFTEGTDPAGMLGVMRRVHYTNAFDLNGERAWYSEYYGMQDTDGDGVPDTELTRDTPKGERSLHGDAKRAGIFACAMEASSKKHLASTRDDGDMWQTVHTSVFDYAARAIFVTPQQGTETFRFSLE